ncbi:uncharacterized protein RAG0_02328 [Rhynchosporium agropyri]|uniref:DUF7728 domain-containing protein n=1 Tax=Rhynchosporium agropyri TaxID=914238 RepID=A0A1E1K0Z4_9HELO|nr:uncharacterized protein RAG0_02328 [Rhynchosporium agropyri]
MYLSQLGAVAALAGLSSAFLVPPKVSSADIGQEQTEGRVIEIACPGCPVLTNVNGKVHSVEAESTLQLNFTLSHGNGAEHLLLNGQQIYPIDPDQTVLQEPLTAAQMMKSSDQTWKYAANPRVGYSIAVGQSQNSPDDKQRLVAVHLEIIEVAEKFVTGLPAIDLQLVETPSGKLMIGQTEVAIPVSPSSDRKCKTLLCKWRAIVADRVKAMKKGCGHMHQKPKARPADEHKHHSNPKHGSPRPWRHHHKQGTVTRLLRSIVFHVLVPVLIGVMVGITASLVGMVVGHIVIFTWRMLFRRGQTSYNAVSQGEEAEDSTDVDSKTFLVGQGPPPQYEIVLEEKKEVL